MGEGSGSILKIPGRIRVVLHRVGSSRINVQKLPSRTGGAWTRCDSSQSVAREAPQLLPGVPKYGEPHVERPSHQTTTVLTVPTITSEQNHCLSRSFRLSDVRTPWSQLRKAKVPVRKRGRPWRRVKKPLKLRMHTPVTAPCYPPICTWRVGVK